MKCYLIRHGMTQDNIDLNFSGCQTDTPLLPEGIGMLDAVDNVPGNSLREGICLFGRFSTH